MNIDREFHEKIYEKLVSILNVKFKTQLNGTDIFFVDLYKMQDLISEKESYLLILNQKNSFRFSNNKDFFESIIIIVKNRIDELNNEYRELQLSRQNDVIIDDYEMYNRNEHIGYCGQKLSKLLNKMREFRDLEIKKI